MEANMYVRSWVKNEVTAQTSQVVSERDGNGM